MKHANGLFHLLTLPVLINAGLVALWPSKVLASALVPASMGSSQLAVAGQVVSTISPTQPVVAVGGLPVVVADLAITEPAEQQFDLSIMEARGLRPELGNYFRHAARFSAGKNIIDVVVNGVPLGRKTAFFSQTGSLCFSALFLQSVGLIGANDRAMAKNDNNKNNQPKTNADGLITGVAPAQSEGANPVRLSITEDLPDASACPGPSSVSAQTVVTLSPSQVSADIITPAETVTALPAARIEQGGSAAIFNYRASTFASTFAGGRTNRFTQLDTQAGFNWNDWIVRSNQSYSNQNGQSQVRFANAYAQKTFVDQKQTLQAGLMSTLGPMYGGIPFVGAQWFPETALRSQNRFPITGIAATRARVIVTQNGVILLSTVVPPGPFKLTDYQQGNSTGDFQVQLIEASGAEQRFTIASSDILLADDQAIAGGIYASAGMLSNLNSVNGPRSVPLLTLEKGWVYSAQTAFSIGTLAAGKYASVGGAVRSQVDMGGRMSTHAQTQVARDMKDGASGMLLSSSFGWSPSDKFQVGVSAVVRTARYRSAQEAQNQLATSSGPPLASIQSQMGANTNWSVKGFGNFSVNATHQTLFAAPPTNTYAVSWSTAVDKGQLNVGMARTQQSALANQAMRPPNDSLFVSFNLPLGSDANLSSSVRQNNYLGTLHTVIASSVAQQLNDTLSYQASVEKTLSEAGGDAKNISVSAVPRYTSVTVSAGSTPSMSSYFAQASGGIIISEQGASFAPNPIQDTFAVVKLSNVAGVQLNTPQGTVWSGYNGLTAIPALTPYANSTVEVITTTLPPDVDIDRNVQVVRAGRGAVVNLEMKANKVQRVLLTVSFKGQTLPESLPVLLNDGELFSVSSKNGRIVISSFIPTQTYTVQLQDGTTCKLSNINLSDLVTGNIFQRGVAVCL